MASATNKAVKAGAAYTFGNIFLKGINFLTLPIFTRLLTTEQFGLFNVYVSYETILTIFVGLCLFGSLRTGKYDYKDEYEKYTTSALTLSTCCMFVVLIAANVFYPIFEKYFEFNQFILNILIIHSYAMFMVQFYNTKIALDFEYKRYLLVAGINSIGGTALSIGLIVAGFSKNRSVDRIYGYAFPAILIGLCIWLSFIVKAIREQHKFFNWSYWKYGLRISSPLIIHNLSQQVLNQFDRLMISKMVGEAEAGIYSFIYTVGNILQIIVQSMDSAWSAWFYEKMAHKEYEEIRNRTCDYMLLMTVLYIGFVSLAPEVISLVGTKEYLSDLSMVVPIAFSAYFIFMYSLPVHVEYFAKKTKLIAVGTVVAAVVNFVLNYVCIRNFGYTAAAWTTLVSYVCMFSLHWIFYKKIATESLFPAKTIFGGIAFACIYSVVTLMTINNTIIRWGFMLLSLMILVIWNRKRWKSFVKLLPFLKR